MPWRGKFSNYRRGQEAARECKCFNRLRPRPGVRKTPRLERKARYSVPRGTYKGTKIQGISSLPCESPGVRAIQSLHTCPIRRGVVNVLYDQPGTGISMAGMAVLNDFYRFPNGEETKGIMVSPRGSTQRQLYVEALGEILEISNIKGEIYKYLIPPDSPTMNVVVIVMTQYKDAANALCALNGDKRVQPIEGFYETVTNP
eukprot:scaffold528_cov165-Amphora_coffeaeformis.AAC.2